MYELIKKQIAADYFQQRFPNDGQRFVAWYLRNILFRDMNETRDDITDGGDDKQIDAIVIDDDKTLVRIIQGKFIQSGTVDAEPLREVLSAWIQIKDLARLQNVANHKLQRKLAELATALDEDYEVSFELITTGALTEAALHDLEAFQQELAKLSEKENFDATIHVIDGDELRRRYDFAIENATEVNPPPGYVTISESVNRLEKGMFAQLPRPLLVHEVKRNPDIGRDASIGFGPWRDQAAKSIRDAAIAGHLMVCCAIVDESRAIDEGSIESVPKEALKLVIPVHSGLPDYAVHVYRPQPGSSISSRSKLRKSIMLLSRVEFDAWYEAERRKTNWPAQSQSKAAKVGRPRAGELVPNRVRRLVEQNKWSATAPITALQRLLMEMKPLEIVSDDSLARIVDRLFLHTGDSRFQRRKRRSSRKTPAPRV
jgi:hypothetical protein